VYRGIEITPPFFELGPKGYMFGPEMLRVARCADELSREYQVQVIIDPQYVDIPVIAQQVQRALVFAPHMDSIAPGRGQGAVLPEAIKAAGATGVVLNHVEHRLSGDELARTIRRADEVGLATMVCADDVEEAVSIAATDRAIWLVNPEIRVLHGAGIGSARDVFGVIAAGAQATGSSSAIFTAPDPEAVLGEMIKAVREAWEASH
jgi:triosephosphate isomerase